MTCIDHGLLGNKPEGYHQRRIKGKLYYVHRLAYADHHGLTIEEVPALLRHTCDNPRCVNPEHLIPGTHKDNARDRVVRGRSAKELVAARVLTPEQDLLIYNLRKEKKPYARQNSERQLAAQFGVSRQAIRSAYQRAGRGID